MYNFIVEDYLNRGRTEFLMIASYSIFLVDFNIWHVCFIGFSITNNNDHKHVRYSLYCVISKFVYTCKPYIARRGIYQVTSVSCFYECHINFNFTYVTYLIDCLRLLWETNKMNLPDQPTEIQTQNLRFPSPAS